MRTSESDTPNPERRGEPRFRSSSSPCERSMILLIDDDDVFRSALSELLEIDGHRVQAYRSVDDLPRMEELSGIAALITDYQLAGSEDGLSFARRFHTAYPHVAIVLVTADQSADLEERVRDSPYVLAMAKPFRYRALHKLIHPRRTCAPTRRWAAQPNRRT